MITLCHVNDLEEGNSKGFEVENKYLFAVKKDDRMFL